ncbi:MAG TPA: helix-turn-helix domain-containing protein [Trebonia sp.]|nr:helix-turn-helix domain-containing protein [Trebonia sp.]
MPNAARQPINPVPVIDGIPRTLPAAMRTELPSLTDEVITEIRRLVPEYARSMDGAYGEAFRMSVAQSMKTFVDLVADPSAPRDSRDAMCRLLGEFEAREGRTLDNLQAAYRIGCQIAWRRMAKVVVRAKLSAAVMGALADALFSYADELTTLSAEGYRDEQRRSGHARQQHRARLLRRLLEPGISRAALEEVAEHADWPLPASVTMAALRPVTKPAGGLAGGGVVGGLAGGGIVGGSADLPRLDGDILADLTCARPFILIPGPVAETRQAALAAALEKYRIAIGLTVPLDLAADSLRWAQQALVLSDKDVIAPAPVIRCEDHLVELWLLSDPTLAGQIVQRQMSVLEQIPPHERAWLIDTFEPWLERRGTPTEIAAMLGVHVQTVRYRINRLREIFGDVIDDPDSRLAFELALRIQRLLPEGKTLPMA